MAKLGWLMEVIRKCSFTSRRVSATSTEKANILFMFVTLRIMRLEKLTCGNRKF